MKNDRYRQVSWLSGQRWPLYLPSPKASGIIKRQLADHSCGSSSGIWTDAFAGIDSFSGFPFDPVPGNL
jgi:hypothetical protein